MLKKILFATLFVLIGLLQFTECDAQSSKEKYFSIVENKAEKRVDIRVDGKPFTSYIYPDGLMKPVLYPLRTSTGTLITRGWPLDSRPGEPVDHPHHIGMWFNYGDVNGLDFWNNSKAIPADKQHKYGMIKHRSVNSVSTDQDQAVLEVTADWQKPDGTNLLREDTKFVFGGKGDMRTIERITKLTALKEDVSFKDNKEGLIAIRLARELQHPSDNPEEYSADASGNYRSSEGIEGNEVWGTRGKWVTLSGKIDGEAISLVILDNPKNIGYPTYWHARGYGLFSANPLGQKEFSNGQDELNFNLPAGESVVFRYKILISSGSNFTDDQVNAAFEQFSISK